MYGDVDCSSVNKDVCVVIACVYSVLSGVRM